MDTSHRGHGMDIRTEYKIENGYCELTPLFREAGGYLAELADDLVPCGVETNHIFSLGRRPDEWPNLIDLHPILHRWFHQHLTKGRVACLYAKWRKGGRDWDVPTMDTVAGRYLLGWLSTLELPEQFGAWRDEILANPLGKGGE